MRRLVAVAALVVAVTLVPAAQAKLSLTFDRTSARPGERVVLTFGEYFTSRGKTVDVYLVRASTLGNVIRPRYGGGVARMGPPPRIVGVIKIGQTTSEREELAFRVPATRAGRYAAVVWCSACAQSSLLAAFQGGIPDSAYVRPTRALLRILRT